MAVTDPDIQSFLDYLRFEKRYSRHTVLSYETDLVSFYDYLVIQYGGAMPVSEISHLYIRSWLASLKDEGLAARSINRKISALKSFFKFQLKGGKVLQSPMGKIVAPKNEKRLPQFVADKDIDTLFRHVEFAPDWTGRTERLLLLLFYHTGMRLSEVTGLLDRQVNAATQTIKVLGKGNKERVVPVSADLLDDLLRYRKERDEQFGTGEERFFLNEKGKPLAPRRVYSIVKKYLSLVTTIEKRSPHVLRHTFATHLTSNGADLNAIKELLGHSSLAATQVYTHNTIEKLRNIYQKAHPKA